MKTLKLIFVILALYFVSCSPSTRITASWVRPETNATKIAGKKIFVATLTRNMEVRTKLEDAFAQQATPHAISVIKSTAYFGPDFYQRLPSEQQLLRQIKDTGADAILTVSLLKKESESRYVPGGARYAPFSSYGWYGGFYSYLNYWRPTIYEPGYYVTDNIYFIETNLYDIRSASILWSAQSQTVNPGSIDKFAATYPQVVFQQLMKDRLLPQ